MISASSDQMDLDRFQIYLQRLVTWRKQKNKPVNQINKEYNPAFTFLKNILYMWAALNEWNRNSDPILSTKGKFIQPPTALEILEQTGNWMKDAD